MNPTPSDPQTGLPTTIRLSSTLPDASQSLGPLADLVGTWFGTRGWNLIAVPQGANGFLLLVRPYVETITFTPVGALVPDRGGAGGTIQIPGLQYTLQIADAETNEPLHVENGMWLLLPGTNGMPPQVARLGSVPHGNALLAIGSFGTIAGAPQIPERSALPTTGPGMPFGYLDPYMTTGAPFPSSDVNLLLRDQVKGQNVVQTTVLDVSTAEGGGISNIPFIVKNADASQVQSTYWIETVKDASGQTFLQLQYSQQVDLNFLPQFQDKTKLILWPHTSTNTLLKQ